MTILVWIGVALTLCGLVLLGWCIREALRARRGDLAEDVMKARLQRLVAINLGALALSALGLMSVIMGLSLG